MRLKKFLSLGLVLALLVSCMAFLLPTNSYTAQAGNSKLEILNDTKAFNKSVPLTTNWYFKGDTIGYDGDPTTIKFSELSDTENVLIYRTQPTVSEGNGKTLEVNATIKVETLDTGKSFGIYVGVPRLDFKPTEFTKENYQGSTYIYVVKDGANYKAGVKYLGATEVDVCTPDAIPVTGDQVKFKIEQTDDGKLIAYAGDYLDAIYSSTVYNNGKADADKISHKVGMLGFGSRGELTTDTCKAVVALTSISVINFYQSNPANFNAFETFDQDYFNGEEFVASGATCVQNGMFNFKSGDIGATLRTKHWFSNFELSFDVPYIKRHPDVDANGKVTLDSCHRWTIMFGVNAPDPMEITNCVSAIDAKTGYTTHFFSFYPAIKSDGYSGNTNMDFGVNWTDREGIALSNRDIGDIKNDFFNPMYDGRTFTIKLRVVNGLVTLDMKWEDENTWSNLFTRDIGFTPEGYLGIYGGFANGQPINMSIDNLKLTNLDANAQFADIGFTKSGLADEGDYVFEDPRNPDYLIKPLAGEQGVVKTFLGMNIVVGYITLGVSVLVLAGGVTLFILKKGGKI